MGYVEELRKVVESLPLILAGVGVLILDEANRMLLLRRKDNGEWGIPGDFTGLGESLEDTAR